MVWLPIPLGSYRPWAILGFGLLTSTLYIAHLYNCSRLNVSIFPKKYSYIILLPLLIVLTVLVLQLLPTPLRSIDPNQTKVMLLKTYNLFMLTWLVFYYCNTHLRVKALAISIVVAGLLQAFYALYLVLSPNIESLIFQYSYSEKAMGSFTYQNFFANYVGLCIAMGLGLLLSELNRHQQHAPLAVKLKQLVSSLLSAKVIMRLSLIVLIISLIMTKSRMGNLAFFVALSLTSIFAFFYYKRRPNNLRILIISFFVLDIIIVSALFGFDQVKTRLLETNFQEETRDEVVADTLPMILDKPLFGFGGGSFYTAFPRYQSQPYAQYYDNAHNDYLQFSVELGLFTSGILGLMVLYCLFLSFKTMYLRNTALYQGIAFAGATSIIFMLLQSFVDYSLQSGANSITFMVILSLIVISHYQKEPRRRQRSH